ncbi:MAG: hypothetical protein M1840_002387 [Geoglossum simile]|nr:MAG: hypothetical protein M1840_002387 [Geoglossum simile]
MSSLPLVPAVRRPLNASEESAEGPHRSPSFEFDIRLANQLSEALDNHQNQHLLANLAIGGDQEATLRRILSLRSATSTSSSFAQTHQAMRNQDVAFRKIGFGQCGLVFEQPGRPIVIKIARRFFEESLWMDYRAHSRVMEAFYPDVIEGSTAKEPECRVPRVHYFRTREDKWWNDHIQKFGFTPQFALPTSALFMERILPIPKAAREALINVFCPERLRAAVKQDPVNRDCLVRLYMGRRRAENTPEPQNFPLRNFNLFLDQMIHLDLPVGEYADALAEALALIHWMANVDGYDIEFILGSEPMYQYPWDCRPLRSEEVFDISLPCSTADRAMVDFKKRITRVWVLDFNLCSVFKPTEVDSKALVGHLVNAFFENDPYYPIPQATNPLDRLLWERFSKEYLRKSEEILAGEAENLQSLPIAFIEGCVERERSNLERGLGHGCRFEKA